MQNCPATDVICQDTNEYGTKMVSLHILYGTCIIIKMLTEFDMNLYVLLSHCIMAALIQLLLLSK